MLVKSNYKRPKILINGHFETIYPALFRKINDINPTRERIKTNDGDFLDIDWLKQGSDNLVVICHGLEGNSQKPYVQGMAKAVTSMLHADALMWNYRGCSGEMNHANRFYHSGATDDLQTIISHTQAFNYESIAIIGFSLGGNLTLKYLGENSQNLPKNIKASVVFSVPMDLEASSNKMKSTGNYLYSRRFLKSLKTKIKSKKSLKEMDLLLPLDKLDEVKDLFHFDDIFTGPLHGFKDAKDYYKSCSSLHFVEDIEIPVLIVNAKNDPFLAESCFPSKLLENHTKVYFESPDHGGHVGFADFKNTHYWSEKRAVDFIKPFL